MSSMPRVTAIVVTYNRHELLSSSLSALLSQSRPPDRILVIDNASTDATPSLFGERGSFCQPAIEYVRLESNRGGAGGFKEGLRLAIQEACDWCWIMDDDVIAQSDALEELLNALDYLVDHGVRPSYLASQVSGADGEVMNVPNVSCHLSENGYPDWCEHLRKGIVRISTATFVSILISAEAVRTIGLPISDYFLWGDDAEYTLRLTSYAGPAFVCGCSKVTHLRALPRAIDTANETDLTRVKNRRRAIRNDLINTHYYQGTAKALRRMVRRVRESAQIAVGVSTLKRAKIKATLGGVVDFLAHRYDLEDLAKLDKNTMRRY